MATIQQYPRATGEPGIPPRWTRSAKQVVGTAYSTPSHVWFTVSGGILSEIYYPTIDHPQVRDLQYLVSDGKTFIHDVRRRLHTTVEYLAEHGLGVRVINSDPDGRYRLIEDIIADPFQPCVLVDTWLEGEEDFLRKLHLYVLLAPHLEVGGWDNNGNVGRIEGREFLTAHKAGTWLALGATVPFIGRSCGYVGTTDGWHDLMNDLHMDYQFASAPNGNIALTAEVDLSQGPHFTLAVGFGQTLHRAVTALFQSLDIPFSEHRDRFIDQWKQGCKHLLPLGRLSSDRGALYRKSCELLLAHEDKRYSGALIASLSIPWGEERGDEDLGGYHLVWTRDLVNSAMGLLAAGDMTTPRRALIYLACTQQPDGGFPQNFWIDGKPYWPGIQLDEVAFPIMLAWRLNKVGGLRSFDPYPMVRRAAYYLITHGPATPQERWEENSGYSPSTLASSIAALVCAACFARQRHDQADASFLEDYADFLESHVEDWTVTNDSRWISQSRCHYVRINPQDPNEPVPHEGPDHGEVALRNQAPGAPYTFPAAEIVDAGFLELVRYGIRQPNDPLIENSLRVVDQALKTDFPGGPCWRRYTHDGYGQRDDGAPYLGWGRGRPWPLLTGERGHYELAAGRDARPYLYAMENFATPTRLLPEQIWDGPDKPELLLHLGGPTGSAMPLMWAHAEYVKLLRSVQDGTVFDLIPEVAERYRATPRRPRMNVWKFNRRITRIPSGSKLRIQVTEPFVLHWGRGQWEEVLDTQSTHTDIGIDFADIELEPGDHRPVRFTFNWRRCKRWEGKDFIIMVD
jgi:glucoamylase